MAVLPVDLILPTGNMPEDWHSVESIQEWIALGVVTAPVESSEEQIDAITTAYAYYRGYRAKAAVLLGSPDSVTLPAVSVSQSNGRYDRMMAAAEAYRLEWEELVAGVVPVVTPVVLMESRTVTVPISHRWV
jgi:hypothetical protein